MVSVPKKEQARLRAEHQPKELSSTALHIQRTQTAGAKIGKTPEQISQDILAAASAAPVMRTYNMEQSPRFLSRTPMGGEHACLSKQARSLPDSIE